MLKRNRAASELTPVEIQGRGELICFGYFMGSYRVCLDHDSGEVIQIAYGPPGETWTALLINSSLEQFIASVDTVLNRYPFSIFQMNGESDDTWFDRNEVELAQAVADLKVALHAIDPAAIGDPDSFWTMFLDDVYMGNFSSDEDVQVGPTMSESVAVVCDE